MWTAPRSVFSIEFGRLLCEMSIMITQSRKAGRFRCLDGNPGFWEKLAERSGHPVCGEAMQLQVWSMGFGRYTYTCIVYNMAVLFSRPKG